MMLLLGENLLEVGVIWLFLKFWPRHGKMGGC